MIANYGDYLWNLQPKVEVICIGDINSMLLFYLIISFLGFMFLKFIGIDGIIRKRTGDNEFDSSIVFGGVMVIALITTWAISILSVV